MSRTAALALSVAYSVLAWLDGTGRPSVVQSWLLTNLFSPKSASATMFRVSLVEPVLLVTHTSMRLMVTPVMTCGSLFMPSS